MSTYNKKLAIAIPTYNRPEILEENLQFMLPDLRLHSIPVFISDDSSDLKTETIIKRLQPLYEHIYYRHNLTGFGHDGNFFATLAMPDCDYVWYIGDSLYIRPNVVTDILEVLNEEVDFCFVNYNTNDVLSRPISSAHDFLIERTWYLTLTGATIYGRDPRSLIIDEERKGKWRNFPQLGLILEYCADNKARLYWYGKPAIDANKKKRNSYWSTNAFDVFVEDWSNFIRSFQRLFPNSEVNLVIKSHAINTGLFNLKSLILFRANRCLTIGLLRKHKVNFAVASPVSPLLAYCISFVPVILADILRRAAVACRRMFN